MGAEEDLRWLVSWILLRARRIVSSGTWRSCCPQVDSAAGSRVAHGLSGLGIRPKGRKTAHSLFGGAQMLSAWSFSAWSTHSRSRGPDLDTFCGERIYGLWILGVRLAESPLGGQSNDEVGVESCGERPSSWYALPQRVDGYVGGLAGVLTLNIVMYIHHDSYYIYNSHRHRYAHMLMSLSLCLFPCLPFMFRHVKTPSLRNATSKQMRANHLSSSPSTLSTASSSSSSSSQSPLSSSLLRMPQLMRNPTKLTPPNIPKAMASPFG